MSGLRPCLQCGRLIRGYCRDCDRQRGSGASRGYDWAWRVARSEHLAVEPMCRSCGQPATDVDHIAPLRSGGSDDHANLQSLCHACHSRKTLRQARAGSSAAFADRRFFIGEGNRPDRVRSLAHGRVSPEVI